MAHAHQVPLHLRFGKGHLPLPSGKHADLVRRRHQPRSQILEEALLAGPDSGKRPVRIPGVFDPRPLLRGKGDPGDPGVIGVHPLHIRPHLLRGDGAHGHASAVGQIEMDVRVRGQHRLALRQRPHGQVRRSRPLKGPGRQQARSQAQQPVLFKVEASHPASALLPRKRRHSPGIPLRIGQGANLHIPADDLHGALPHTCFLRLYHLLPPFTSRPESFWRPHVVSSF